MIFRLRLPGAIFRKARDRAGDEATLHDRLVGYVTQYAAGDTAQQRAGRLVSERMTPTERSDRARHAAMARHHPTGK